MKIKEKPCKSMGKAKDFEGCGKSVFKRTYGLCQQCFKKWLLNTPEGKEKLSKSVLSVKKQKDRDWQKERAALKFKIASPGDIAKTLQAPLNLIARLIDKDHPCTMHGEPMKKTFGCHYHSVGSSPTLRFNLLNIWAGCYSCNGNKGGNIPGYDVQIVDMYGKKKWEYIKFDLVRETEPLNLTKEEMKEFAVEARKIVRELQKADLAYTVQMRWKMREKYNERLGIYPKVKKEKEESDQKTLFE